MNTHVAIIEGTNHKFLHACMFADDADHDRSLPTRSLVAAIPHWQLLDVYTMMMYAISTALLLGQSAFRWTCGHATQVVVMLLRQHICHQILKFDKVDMEWFDRIVCQMTARCTTK